MMFSRQCWYFHRCWPSEFMRRSSHEEVDIEKLIDSEPSSESQVTWCQ
jgi:hypothetical protein